MRASLLWFCWPVGDGDSCISCTGRANCLQIRTINFTAPPYSSTDARFHSCSLIQHQHACGGRYPLSALLQKSLTSAITPWTSFPRRSSWANKLPSWNNKQLSFIAINISSFPLHYWPFNFITSFLDLWMVLMCVHANACELRYTIVNVGKIRSKYCLIPISVAIPVFHSPLLWAIPLQTFWGWLSTLDGCYQCSSW